MTGERGAPTVRVDQLNANTGSVGVQVRVDGRGLQRRSTVPSTQGEPKFTGREAELAAIENELAARQLVVVHGAPGLGKSRLAREYAHRHAASYPGGMFWVPFDQPPPIELAKLLRDTDRPAYVDESLDDQCRRALRELGSASRVLVIYDAISCEQVLRDWLPYDGLDWHLIVISTSAVWASAWCTVEIEALPPEAGHQLVASILDDEAAAARLAAPIAAKAGGVTIELCASAAAAHERLRRGRSVERISADLATGTVSSFESAWRLLSADDQLVLQVASTFATPRVPASLVVSALQRIGWEESRVEDALDNARDRRLAGGDHEGIDVHQLVARFVRARGSVDPLVRRSLLDGLADTAREFVTHPGDVQRRAQLLAHSLDVDDWAAMAGSDFPWHMIGSAIDELGKYAEALRWYERAVAAEEKGNPDGRVDSQSLGISLHQVGSCYSRQGKYAEEPAVGAAGQDARVAGVGDPEDTRVVDFGADWARERLLADLANLFPKVAGRREYENPVLDAVDHIDCAVGGDGDRGGQAQVRLAVVLENQGWAGLVAKGGLGRRRAPRGEARQADQKQGAPRCVYGVAHH